MSNLRTFLTALMVLSVAAIASAQEKKKIDNPEYANWSKFKSGTTAKMTMVSDAGGQKFEMSRTSKLLEVTPDKCVVEDEGVSKVAGMEIKQPATKREVPKTLEVDAKMAESAKSAKPEGTTEEGTETVKVGGAEVKTKWYKFKTKLPMGGGESEGQMWISEDVPGMMVKMVTKANKAEMKMELVEFTKK